MAQTKGKNYYPTESELSDPRSIRSVLQQVLQQHYALRDSHAQLQQDLAAAKQQISALTSTPAPMGAINSKMLGLPIQPVDTNTLADGTKLTYVKATGNFQFI